ncbi:hypothetical protein HHK36_010875 [Tetracentron sinense]|uniref:PROP1-like PPR domain-containing protein n=1 Tax=Tetracentron sinense TaxID=13715 RepID=A0A835DJZ0_TETSI|nr:hypothetical protein HHK36_010875 [Tetracentron sinense]
MPDSSQGNNGRPRMRVFVGSSSFSPPNPNPHHHLNKHKPSILNPTKLSCSSPSRPPLLMNVHWNLAPRHGNRLKYYADLASKLAEDERFEDFLMIIESVLGAGTDPHQFVASLNIKLVSRGISGFIREGRTKDVIRVLSKVEKLGISMTALFDDNARKLLVGECRRLVNGGELEEVVDLMEILAGFGFPVKYFVEPFDIIKMCVKKRNSGMAIRYACILPHAHILFSSIIHEFGKQRDMVSALTAFEASKCQPNGPNMYACRTIIDVCGLCGDYLKSRYIYEYIGIHVDGMFVDACVHGEDVDLSRFELLAQKVTPNTYVFNSLMNVNAHDLRYTLHVYKHMQDLDVSADTASYNILLKACCLAGRVDLAQDIYKEVDHLQSTGVLKLDVFTYSTIIKVFADAKMWQMALKIKEDMLSAGVTPNIVTWSSLIGACANAGLVEQAIRVFEDMLLAGCEPNSQSCNILLHACVEACQYDRAFRIFQSWKENGFQKSYTKEWNGNTESLRLLIVDAERTRENCIPSMPSCTYDPQHLSFAKVVPFLPTTATYNILMKACGTDYYRAKALMDEMKTAGLSPNHISWSILIDIYGGSGNVGGAMQALKTMRDAGMNPDVVAYTTAIKACIENKNLKIAFSLFEEMKRYRIQPNLVTYNTLLRARSRYGSLQEVQQCLAVYQDMRKAGYKSNDYFLKELIEEWCEGVIMGNNKYQGLRVQGNSFNKTGGERPQSVLLEKVAAHLQKDIAESLAIDLRGLSKVEARIVVLAVLRMIKESYTLGNPVKDDMVIILGVRIEGPGAAKQESEVQDAVIKLLRDELALSVVLVGPIISVDRNDLGSPLDLDPNRENPGKNRLYMEFESSARRPAVLRRLKVTRKSLYHWLQKRMGATRR